MPQLPSSQQASQSAAAGGIEAPLLDADVASASDDDDRVIPLTAPTNPNVANGKGASSRKNSRLSTSCGSESSVAYEDEDVGAVGGFGGFAPQFFGGRPGGAVPRNNKGPRTWDGVFLPVSLAVFGAVLFLRLPWCIGQAGLLYTLLAILCCFALSGLTLISLAAMSTNGLTDKGGAYMMASRTLGPQIGLSVGVMLVIANIIAGAIYLVATSPVVVLALPWEWLTESQRSHSYFTPVVIASIFLFTLLVVGLLKADRPFRGISMLLTIVALIDLIVAMGIETQEPDEIRGFTGFNASILKENLQDDYDPGVGFQTILAVLLPGATGILPGLSLSGDLRHAEKAIPRGIGYAWVLSFTTYVVVAILIAASYTQEALKATNVPLHDPNRKWAFVPGEICACFASVLAGLAGSAKVVEAISTDDLVPLFSPVTRVLRTYPRLRLFCIYILMQMVIFIGPYSGQYNAASAWASVVFCAVFLSLNLGTFLSRASGVSSFRPTYAFFNRSTAGIGALGSVAMMFAVGPVQSLAVLVLLALLFLGFEALHDPQRVFWGDAAQPITFHLVRKWLLLLDVRKEHPSHWRPNVLQITTDVESSLNLIHFANNLKKGGLYQLGIVIKGDFRRTRHEVSRWRDLLLCFIRASGIKGFPAVVYGPTLRSGVQMLLTDSGLGGMRPNTILLSIDDFCERAAHTRNALYHVSHRQQQHHHLRSLYTSARPPPSGAPVAAQVAPSAPPPVPFDPTLRSVWATGLGAVTSTRAQPHSLYTSTGRAFAAAQQQPPPPPPSNVHQPQAGFHLGRHALNSARGNGAQYASSRSLPDMRVQSTSHASPINGAAAADPAPGVVDDKDDRASPAAPSSKSMPIRRANSRSARVAGNSSGGDDDDELAAASVSPPAQFEQTMPRGVHRPIVGVGPSPTPPTTTASATGGDESTSIASPAGAKTSPLPAAVVVPPSDAVHETFSAPTFVPDASSAAAASAVDLFDSANSISAVMSRKTAFRSVCLRSAHDTADAPFSDFGGDASSAAAAPPPPPQHVGRYRSRRQRSNSVAAAVSKVITRRKVGDHTESSRSLLEAQHQHHHQHRTPGGSTSINHASGLGRLPSASSGSRLNLLGGDDDAPGDSVTLAVPTVASGAFDAMPSSLHFHHHRRSTNDLFSSEGKRSSAAWASPDPQGNNTQTRFSPYESHGGGGKSTHHPKSTHKTLFVTNRNDADEDAERETIHRMRRVRAAAALNSGGDLSTYTDELEFFGLVNDACESQFSVLLARNFSQLDRDDVADCKPFAYVDVWLPPESDPILFLTAYCLSLTSVWAENARLRVVGLSWTEEEAEQARAITVSILKHHRIRADVHVIVIKDRCETIFEAIKPTLLRYAKQLKAQQQQQADEKKSAAARDAAAPATSPPVPAPPPAATTSAAGNGSAAPATHGRSGFLQARAAVEEFCAASSAASSDNGALGKTLADLALMEESVMQTSFFGRTTRPPPHAAHAPHATVDSAPSAAKRQSPQSTPPPPLARPPRESMASTAAVTATADDRGMSTLSREHMMDYERMQSYMGHDPAAVDDAMRTAFAASIADPVQRAITLNYLIRDEVSRGGGRSKLILMRADDPVAGAALGAANADVLNAAASVAVGSAFVLPGQLEAAAAVADDALRQEALTWTTHVDILTAGLPPVVLFCGGGSMMQTPDW